jgi:septal ring factor EnvC (AmiA/AmiB activator)
VDSNAPTEPPPAPAAAKKPEAPAPTDPQQRIDGIRAWLAQVDRRLGVRTYALGAAAVLALAAGIVGVVLAISAKDESATKDQLNSVREELGVVEQQATSAAEEEVSELSERVSTLEERISSLSGDQTRLERELEVVQDDIDDLRSAQNGDGGGDGGGGSGGGGSGNP